MARTKLYAGIYVALFVLATAQVLVEDFGGLGYWPALVLILVLSTVKAVVVAGYYQHLRWESRSLTYLALMALFVVGMLAAASTYSITGA
jgi:cytochrome c oxidase subunit 4